MRDVGILQDLHHLAGMQLVIDRHRDTLGRPNPEQQFNDLRAIFTDDRDPRPCRTALPHRARQAQRPAPQLPPSTAEPPAVIDRPAIGKALRRLIEQREQVHRAVHSDVSANFDRYLVELHPPSTTMVCPLMKLPPGEHKNATVLATSSIVPNR